MTVSYEIACASGNRPDKGPLLQGFLSCIASPAVQAELPDPGYVSLPAALESQVENAFTALN